MAGTLTYEDKKPNSKGHIGKVTISWTSDSSGNVNGTYVPFNGFFERIVTNPTDGPSANYDITLDDADGLDLANGDLANRHTTTSQAVVPSKGTYHLVSYRGLIEPKVENAGDTKSGVVHIYYS